MRRWTLVVLAIFLGSAALAAQPTFTRIVVQDAVPLDLAPRAADRASDGDLFVTRACLSPGARARLAAGLGFDEILTVDDAAAGPAILSGNRLARIPGDRRLRGELGAAIALRVLGVGADTAESVAAADGEALPRGVLIGAHPDAIPPPGWRRVGGDDARPVVWTREVEVHVDRIEGTRRVFTILDDWPFDSAGHRWRADLAEHRPREQGPFAQHLQGIARDPAGALYWSWTDRLVKTDARGAVLASVDVPDHHGDLTWHDGKVVVATNHGRFNDPAEGHDSWAYVYDDASLELVGRHALPQCRYGAGGICWARDRYVVVTGLPVELEHAPTAGNEVHEYDAAFRHLRTVRLDGGWTRLGIQTAEFAYGRFLFGCYGAPRCVLVASPDLAHVRRVDGVDAAYGVVAAPFGLLLTATDERHEDGHHARLDFAAGPILLQ